ncbi:S8 family serine peptidase [Geodermatophilus sp. SYSU D00700]
MLGIALGFGGAAAIDTALAGPAISEASDFGPAGDGRTRLLVDAPAGIDATTLAALEDLPAVDTAQLLFDGSALVAGFDITPDTIRAALPDAQVEVSVSGEIAADPISDPMWASYGWNLSNTGSNSYGQTGVAGADVAAPTGWRAGTGRGVTVAVIDTGVMTDHPDLAGAFWRNTDEVCGSPADNDGNGKPGDCAGWNYYANSANVVDADNAHGTNVAGVLGARAGNGEGSAGVAPDVTIMPLVIGRGSGVDLLLGAEAIRYAADNGADVVNASWGGPGAAQQLADAIDYAVSKGVVVVAAAGNDAANRDTSMFYPASLNRPGMVTVGSSTAADTASSSSAYGAGTVDLFAPGNLVLAPWNDGSYKLVSGTSIAAPNVAGAFALYRAQDRSAGATALVDRLLGDLQPRAAFTGRSVTGGRLSLTELGQTAAGVSYTFTGMSADPGTVTPTIVTSGSAPAGAYAVRLRLGMEHEGQLYALTQQQVTVGGVTATTDDTGAVTVDLGSRPSPSATVTPSMELAQGRYVLTAQLVLDGADVGTAYAAPLLVGVTYQAPDTGSQPGNPTPSPGGSSPPAPGGSTPPSTTQPGTSTPGTPAPGGSTPPSATQPGTSTPGGTPAPGGSTPPGSTPPAPGSPTPPSATQPGTSTPGTSTPGTSTPGTPAPGGSTPPSTSQPGTSTPGGSPAPGGSQPGTPAPGGSTPPSSPVPGGSTPAPGGSSPEPGGQQTYPGVGPFGLTSINPTRVSTAGGTGVTITGRAVPAGARVRVGSSAQATVTAVSATSVTFTTPARAAGTYDVYVFAPDGTSSVLAGGLTYLDGTGGVSPTPTPAPGTPQPGTQQPGAGGGTRPPGDGPVTGPRGERLVSSALFTALGPSIWRLDCSRACSGLAV